MCRSTGPAGARNRGRRRPRKVRGWARRGGGSIAPVRGRRRGRGNVTGGMNARGSIEIEVEVRGRLHSWYRIGGENTAVKCKVIESIRALLQSTSNTGPSPSTYTPLSHHIRPKSHVKSHPSNTKKKKHQKKSSNGSNSQSLKQ